MWGIIRKGGRGSITVGIGISQNGFKTRTGIRKGDGKRGTAIYHIRHKERIRRENSIKVKNGIPTAARVCGNK